MLFTIMSTIYLYLTLSIAVVSLNLGLRKIITVSKTKRTNTQYTRASKHFIANLI